MNLCLEEPYHSGERKWNAFLKRYPELKFAMRAGFFYVVLVMSSVPMLLAHPVKSQGLDNIYVTIEAQNEDLPNLLKKIETQTGLLFAYQLQQVRTVTNLTLPKATRSVKEMLDVVLNGTSLSYRQVDNSVIIFLRKTTTEGEKKTAIRGAVMNKADERLPGVNVIVKGTNNGTSTDAEGMYSVEASESDVLVFSFIGFKTIETLVGSRIVVDVTMEEDVTTLEEVQVVGNTYLSSSKERSTSSIVKITSKDIERQPVTSPLMALQGRVPGLEISPQTGGPGSAPKVRIRGNNSLRNDGGFPLYIIDGIAIEARPIISDNTTINGGSVDPLSTISPSNIESIEVLKDADATAIYGSRGANGVIVIKTKQSKGGDVTTFDLTAYGGVGKISNRVELLNTEQYLGMRKEAFRNDNVAMNMNNAYDLLLWDTTRYTDWQKELLGGASYISDVQGVLSGGNASTSFRLGVGYHEETLVFPGDFNYQRMNGSLSANHLSASKKFRISTNVNFGFDKNKIFSDLNIITAALTLPPNAPSLYDENGDLNWVPKPDGFSSFKNPLAALRKTDNSTTGNLLANTLLTYQLHPGLNAKVNIGFTDLNNDETSIVPISSDEPEFANSKTGRSTFVTNKRGSWVIEPQLAYEKLVSDHDIAVVIGSTLQSRNYNYKAIYAEGYTSDAVIGSLRAASSYNITETISLYKYLSIFARAQYSYKEKYLLSVSLRRDGSSRFGDGKRFGDFYSVAPAWIFSNESFIKDSFSFLSFGKLRTSFGTTGNDQIGDYKYQNTFSFGSLYQGNSSLVTTALFNPDFAWEVTKKMEVAIELGFVKNRVSLEANWYRNLSSNQLVEYQLAGTTGFASVFSNFNATIQNNGLELMVSSVNLNKTRFKWNTSFNVAFPRNKLIEFDGIENSPYSRIYKVGEPLSIQRRYMWEGVDTQTGLHRFSDVNNNGVIDDGDRVFTRPRDRLYYGGLLNTIQVDNFELSFLLQFTSQRADKMLLRRPGQYANQPVQALSHWEREGDVSDNSKFTQATSSTFGYLTLSNYNDTDASFMRLKTLSFSYRFNDKILDVMHLKDFRIFLQGQNLLTITRYVNLDPETGSALPPLRMVTVGLSAKF